MPNFPGYTYVVLIVVVAAIGVGYGLWSSNNTALKKIKEKIIGTDDTEVRLKKIKTNLELEIKQLQEDYVDLVSKIESASMKLNKVIDPEDQRSSKGLKLQNSGVCKVQISHEPPHSVLTEDSVMEEELKLGHTEMFENPVVVQDGHLETGVGVTEDVDLEQVNFQIESNRGLDFSEDAQDSSYFLERKQQLLNDTTYIENQLTENKVRQTQLIQENKECENRKGVLTKEIRELELLKKNLEEEVGQMKAQRREMRARKDSRIKGLHRKAGSVDVEMSRGHRGRSLRERLKNIKAKSSYSGHSQSLCMENDPERKSPLLRQSEANFQSISTDDKSSLEKIDKPVTNISLSFSENRTPSAPDTGGKPDAGGDPDTGGEQDAGADWSLSTIFLT